jgi:hypothetical protein
MRKRPCLTLNRRSIYAARDLKIDIQARDY